MTVNLAISLPRNCLYTVYIYMVLANPSYEHEAVSRLL